MRVGNVLRNQNILLIPNGALFINHLNTTATGLISRLHNPQSIFICVLPQHLESVEIEGEDVGGWHEVVGLGVGSALFV